MPSTVLGARVIAESKVGRPLPQEASMLMGQKTRSHNTKHNKQAAVCL